MERVVDRATGCERGAVERRPLRVKRVPQLGRQDGRLLESGQRAIALASRQRDVGPEGALLGLVEARRMKPPRELALPVSDLSPLVVQPERVKPRSARRDRA